MSNLPRIVLGISLLIVSIDSTVVVAASLPGLTIQGLAVDPVDASVIYAATSAGIYRSTDRGGVWTKVTPNNLTYNYFTSVAIDPTNHCAIYAGVYANPFNANTNAIILRSLDCGVTWGIPAGTLSGAVGVSVAVTGATPSIFYYSYYTNGSPGRHSIARSVGGSTTVSFAFEDGTYILATDPADPCTIVAGTIFGNVIRSTDCGAMSWSSVGSNLGSRVWGVAVHPSNHATMLAATTNGLYRKADAAAGWTRVMNIAPSRVQAVSFESGNPLVAYAGGSNGIVYKSTDGGLTWNPLATLSSAITALAAAPAPSVAMYAGGDGYIINVGPANAAPTISDIANVTINEDTATNALAFTVGDAETPAASLTVSGSSSNTTIVPNANIVFGGSGATRTVTVTPAANQNGSATITVSASDGTDSTSDTFTLTVNAVNDAPTISDIANQTITEDGATGAVSFTVGDIESSAASLTLSGSSSNTTLVPNANIVFGGSGANRTVTVTPAANQNGSATITVTVSDGTTGTSETFVLTVSAVNDAPTISNIAAQTIVKNQSTSALAFTVDDLETAPGSLSLSAASSNTTVVPVANIAFGGSGTSRTVTVTPASNQSGVVTVTITVGDGAATATSSFELRVLPYQPFTDQTLVRGQTVMRALHITELRTRINARRVAAGLGDFTFTDATLGVGTSVIRRIHIVELRTALAELYARLSLPAPTFTEPSLSAGSVAIKAVHIEELRDLIGALEL